MAMLAQEALARVLSEGSASGRWSWRALGANRTKGTKAVELVRPCRSDVRTPGLSGTTSDGGSEIIRSRAGKPAAVPALTASAADLPSNAPGHGTSARPTHYTDNPSGLMPCSASVCRSGAQVRENREHAAVVVRRLLQAELTEDLAHVRLDRLRVRKSVWQMAPFERPSAMRASTSRSRSVSSSSGPDSRGRFRSRETMVGSHHRRAGREDGCDRR